MWWPETLQVIFAPEGVRYCARPLLPWRKGETGLLPVAGEGGTAAWQPWAEALAHWLAQRPARRRILHVVLYDRFVRYAVLQWRPGIVNRNEWLAYARHRFREIHGEQAVNWAIRVAAVAPGETAIAAAIDDELLRALGKLVPTTRLASLQPRFVLAFNHWRRRLKGERRWFVLAESGRVCAGLMRKGRWQALRNEGCTAGMAAGLEALLHRHAVAGDADAKATVYVGGAWPSAGGITELDGHPCRVLPATFRSPRLALALGEGG